MNEVIHKSNSSFNKYLIKSGEDNELNGGYNEYKFDNGYGASVIRNKFSYGGSRGLFELAVLDNNSNLTYDTPVTSDVIGHLTWEGVEDTLMAIYELPMCPEKQIE